MILVMNKKHGVGCTTLTYNLGRLFELPIYVDKDNFMIDSYHKELFPTVGKITASKKSGIFDIGADYKKAYVKKFINQSKVIVIPLEFGYESIIYTIDTIKYIREIDYTRPNPQEINPETPIVLVLNRLDKSDSDRDFQYKEYLKSKFEDEAELFFDNKLILTYLRNSYSIYSNLDNGKYFLDNFINEHKDFYKKNIENFEYDTFHYLVNKALSKTDYKNEDIYLQDKDMVEFRNIFNDSYPNYRYNYDEHYLNKGRLSYEKFEDHCKSIVNHKKVSYDDKLIKDMAFITHTIFEFIADEENLIRKTMYPNRW